MYVTDQISEVLNIIAVAKKGILLYMDWYGYRYFQRDKSKSAYPIRTVRRSTLAMATEMSWFATKTDLWTQTSLTLHRRWTDPMRQE